MINNKLKIGDHGNTHLPTSQNTDPERDLMEGTSKQRNDMIEQNKRYSYMNSENQHVHSGHGTSISSCQNTGGYTDTLTYKKSVRI